MLARHLKSLYKVAQHENKWWLFSPRPRENIFYSFCVFRFLENGKWTTLCSQETYNSHFPQGHYSLASGGNCFSGVLDNKEVVGYCFRFVIRKISKHIEYMLVDVKNKRNSNHVTFAPGNWCFIQILQLIIIGNLLLCLY